MQRLRLLRQSEQIRHLMQENFLKAHELIAPLFVAEPAEAGPIPNFLDVAWFCKDELQREVDQLLSVGVQSIMLFPKISDSLKNATGDYALDENNIVVKAIKKLKDAKSPMLIFADVALDPYTCHGHDGLLNENQNDVDNDKTVEILKKQALLLARAGADGVCPSDMMDGRIGAIRDYLDMHGFTNTLVVSYSCKFASNFYGPFRGAVGSNLKGNKKTYQLNYANRFEALSCAKRDINEGASVLIVKPAISYLDIIHEIKDLGAPVWAYQVSGEYVMLGAAAAAGAFDFTEALLETTLSIKRAGAKSIITYGAKTLANFLIQENSKGAYGGISAANYLTDLAS